MYSVLGYSHTIKYFNSDKWHFTKEGDFSNCRSLSGEKCKHHSSSNSGSNKHSKYKESSYGRKELTTLMEGANSEKANIQDQLLLAADLLQHSSDSSCSSDESVSSSEHRRSRRKKLKKFMKKSK